MEKLVVHRDLLNKNNKLTTDNFCAPIFIASQFLGMALAKEKDLISTDPEKYPTIRNGTMTFVAYRNEYFAVTCRHVEEFLTTEQNRWKQQQETTEDPLFVGYQLFIPLGNRYIHFNYKLTSLPTELPDIAIARIEPSFLKKVNRKAITLFSKGVLPKSGIATGYPEYQRVIKQNNNIDLFSPKCVSCYGAMELTALGRLCINGIIDDHQGLDNLSGMSGGPIIWSTKDYFGLAGILYKGWDVQPEAGKLVAGGSLSILGELITPALFQTWLTNFIPPLKKLHDDSKMIVRNPKINAFSQAKVKQR